MTQSMHPLSPFIVQEFCKLCDWANEVWLNHRELFEHNPRGKELMESFAAEELVRLSIISHEYSLLQIIKLHDKAIVNGNVTLGIDYIMTFGGWSGQIKEDLQKLADKLDSFAVQLKTVRNKILSHNDLSAILAGSTLGAFTEGADVEYFKTLIEFVDVVHNEVIGGPWPFNRLVVGDVAAFLGLIKP